MLPLVRRSEPLPEKAVSKVEKHEQNLLIPNVEPKLRAKPMPLAGTKQTPRNGHKRLRGEEEKRAMTMIVNPHIKVLSNDVVFDTASAVKKFFELCAEADLGYVVLPQQTKEKVVAVNDAMARVVTSQRALLDALENITDETVAFPGFQKAVDDLAVTVSKTESAIAETCSAPAVILAILQRNLDTIAQQNSHIDSYVESFRVAFDENCSAILADMASKIMAG